MFAGGRLARALGSIQYGVELDEDAARKQLIRVGQELVADNMAIVLNKPGTKHPMCTLTATERKAADQAAKDDAAAREDPAFHKREHACGLAHAITDPKTATRVLTRVAKRERFNIGIEPRQSKLLIVDLDTAAQVAKFMLRAGTKRPTLTVQSPGSQDRTGEWVHRDGGHIHFEVTDQDELPIDEGIYTDPDGWTATWGEHQVLVPPSVRAEGAYVLVGSTYPLPSWLRDLVTDESAGKRKRRTEARALREQMGPSVIDDWAAGYGWAPILRADGWIETGLTKNCGCPQWTAPGEHASPESATAHEVGCAAYTCDRGHGPLHVWTDNPSEAVAAAISAYGRRTLTMAQVLAYTEGAGNMRATLAEYGVPWSGDPTVLTTKFRTWDDVETDPDVDKDEDSDEEEEPEPELDYDERMIRIEIARELRRRTALERIAAMDQVRPRLMNMRAIKEAPRPGRLL
ncbi:MAG TPA: bifunctional DNA primase/polymerase [Mycobacterium sp.]|nr:bifunctional DNA primase/polymerase [Mycobacterium sp.]